MAFDSNYRTRFAEAYMDCALWSSMDEDGNPLDDGRDLNDIHSDAQDQIRKECDDFIDYASELLEESELDPEQAGHDFWLTRNGHGAGFWDRGLGEVGDALSRAAKTFGSSDLYVGDTGDVHVK